MENVSAYLRQIERNLKRGDSTEHSHRPALKSFLESLQAVIQVTNEPKRRTDTGAPDMIAYRGKVPVGYIETKDVGADLRKEAEGEQLRRYRNGLPNLILTDYLEFHWYRDAELVLRAALGSRDKKGRITTKDPDECIRLLNQFLSAPAKTVDKPKDLAKRMGDIAQIAREVIFRAVSDEHEKGPLHSQMDAFREVLLHDLKPEDFADMYAQTIAYGLFAAKCSTKPGEVFTRETAAHRLPKTNPFLRKTFGHIAGPELDDRVVWVVEELVNLLNHSDMEAILKDFGRRTRQDDPVVHFYEDFLAEYDPKMREARGVYYTPEPVVSYIVRSIDIILQKEFGLADGLADKQKIRWKPNTSDGEIETHRLHVLDPALGTGTFLYFVIQQVYERFLGNKGLWPGYVREHLLPRIHGFELLMAPYAVAHMKLGIELEETRYDFQSDDRLSVYLTNSLEEAFQPKTRRAFTDFIIEEANAASSVKRDYPVMVVLGNPPYSGHSANRSWIEIEEKKGSGKNAKFLKRRVKTFIGRLLDDYYVVDGRKLEEKNPKWLQDDYVKFIRFAQWRIERTGRGILAFITNHGYLDNPTFRGMRQNLMKTFDKVYILDLHGNSKKKEHAPDGGTDQNVFDIRQGVAIGLFVKTSSSPERTQVFHEDIYGLREIKKRSRKGEDELVGGKYHYLYNRDINATQWQTLQPDSPWYLFKPFDKSLWGEYGKWWKINEVFPVNSVGIVTARDRLTIHFTPEDVWDTVRDFVSLAPEEARRKYKLGDDVQDWKVEWAQNDIRNSGPVKGNVVPILYRPFDVRYTYFTGESRGFICRPRAEMMRHILDVDNLALCTTRSIEIERGYEHCFVSRCPITHHTVSMKEVNYLFPLYTYPSGGLDPETQRRANLDPKFLSALKAANQLELGDAPAKDSFTPEDVLHYAYAVFHSPTYRARYEEFLAIDFPRLPLPGSAKLFRELAALGAGLTALHLVQKAGPNPPNYPVAGSNLVEKVAYDEKERRVWINKTQYFAPVPPEVWGFHIGGYQVCEKWLKDRKGRKLSNDDLEHYRKVVANLGETIRIMAEIDAVIESHGAWPRAFQTEQGRPPK